MIFLVGSFVSPNITDIVLQFLGCFTVTHSLYLYIANITYALHVFSFLVSVLCSAHKTPEEASVVKHVERKLLRYYSNNHIVSM